ncbi:UNVERIFIED_CONTAM: hypothetical protein Slati_3740500 [Sesamum latifolium]|uniref:Reverse transcriptase zinc-binding domain-containing protein n=1 Tax=Sesamum latifolium TaxID=2727402 RepID=A0AAW2U3D6_9LAMI
MVQSLFWPEDSTLILHIPLNFVGAQDILIWHYSSTGLFTVRSAYHLALSLASRAETSTARWSRSTWQKIWQAQVPNKAKLFIWRAVRNILPTAMNLKKRLPFDTFSCPFCANETEQPIHTLLHCTFARQVADFAQSYLAAFVKQGTRKASVEMPFHSSWISPPTTGIKVNFDGAVLNGGLAFGIGVVARDAAGKCLAWMSLRLDRGGPAAIAEAYAAREACRLAIRQHWRQVIFEGDCEPLMLKLSSPQQDCSLVSPVVFDICSLVQQIESVLFSLVRRAGNSVADFLAHQALNLVGDSSFFPMVLTLFCVTILSSNLNAFPLKKK